MRLPTPEIYFLMLDSVLNKINTFYIGVDINDTLVLIGHQNACENPISKELWSKKLIVTL